MLWCYSDYDPETFEHPPLDEAIHERSFGLWRADGTPKPAVDVVKAFAGATRLPPPGIRALDRHRPRALLAAAGVELPRLYERYLARSNGG